MGRCIQFPFIHSYPGYHVHFIQEENARSVRTGALEQIPDVLFRLAGNAGDQLRAGNGEHRKPDLAGDAMSQKGLSAT